MLTFRGIKNGPRTKSSAQSSPIGTVMDLPYLATCRQAVLGWSTVIALTLLVLMPVTDTVRIPPGAPTRGFKRVCYFGSWSMRLENEKARMDIDDIDPFMCTHLIYAFGKINVDSLSVEGSLWDDESTSEYEGNYARFNALKLLNPKLKTLLSLGGAKAGSYAFNHVVASSESRWIFIQNVIDFLRRWRFDGVDLDWEYPGLPERGTTEETREQFNDLVKEMRATFEDEASSTGVQKLLLSVAVGVAEKHVTLAYSVPQLARNVDFLNLMTYDFHGGWSRFTGGNSPLYSRYHDRFDPTLSMDWAVRRWVKAGAPPKKIVLGISAQGRTFKLRNVTDNGVGSFAGGHGDPGPITQEKGILGYQEICDMISKKGARREWDELQSFPYAYYKDQWVGYDNPRSVTEKSHWIYKRRLGGAMIWSLDLDDYSGRHCGLGHFPLTNAMRKVLDGRKVLDRSVRKNNSGFISVDVLVCLFVLISNYMFS